MKISIVKDIDSLRIMARKTAYESHLIGFWDGDECVIVKDRLFGGNNIRLTSAQLSEYIQKI